MRLFSIVATVLALAVLLPVQGWAEKKPDNNTKTETQELRNVKGSISGTAIDFRELPNGGWQVLCYQSNHRCICWYDNSTCITIDPDGHGIGARDVDLAFGLPEYLGEEYNEQGDVIGSLYLINALP